MLKRAALKIGKIILYAVAGILILLVAAILLLRLPSVQQYVTDKATAWVSGKTRTKISIQKLYIGFPKNVVIEGLFAEDQQHDTLICLNKLEVDIGMLKLLDNTLAVNNLEVTGLVANVHRTLPDSSFNFDFIIDAFAGKKEPAPKPRDTTSSSFAIEVGTIDLTDLRLLYDDAVSGIYAKGSLGELALTVDEINLQKLAFKVDELSIDRTFGVLEIRKKSSEPSDTSSGLLPYVAANKLTIDQVVFGFHDIPDSSFFDCKVGSLLLEPNEIDLNKQWIDINTIDLQQSEIRIAMKEHEKDQKNAKDKSSSSNWRASVKKIRLDHNAFSYNITNLPVLRRGMDYNHLAAENIRLEGNDLYYSPNLIKGMVNDASLKERCGLQLNRLHTRFVYDSIHAELADLLLQTSHTRISNYAFISYPSMASLSKNPGVMKVNLSLKNTSIATRDILCFAPDLIKEPIIARNQNRIVLINGKLKGRLSKLVADHMVVSTASQTAISFDGTITGLPDGKNAVYDLNLKALTTGRSDMEQLLPPSMLPASIRVPDQLVLTGKAKGSLNNLAGNFNLKSSDGAVELEATYLEKKGVPYYTAAIQTRELHVGHILKQESVGTVSSVIRVKGESFDPKAIKGEITAAFSSLQLKGYDYSNINLKTDADTGRYQTEFAVDDPNLSLHLSSDVSINKPHESIALLLDLKGANLKALNLTSREIRSSAILKADIQQFDMENMKGNVSISKVGLIKDGKKYVLDSLVAATINQKRSSRLSVKSAIIQVDYKGSTGLHELVPALQNHMAKYIGHRTLLPDTFQQDFVCSLQLNPHPVLSEILFPELTQFSGISASATFNSTADQLKISIISSYIQYSQNKITGLDLEVNSDHSGFTYDASVSAISGGNFSLPKTGLKGVIHENVIDFSAYVIHPDSGNRLLIAGSVDLKKEQETRISIANGKVVFDNQSWTISEHNEIVITPKGLNVQQFQITHEDAFIKAQSESTDPNAPVNIIFGKFELGTLSKIVETDSVLLRGTLNGEIHIKKLDPFAFTSDLSIQQVTYKRYPLGDIRINADNLSKNRYSASLVLSGNENNATLKGFYTGKEVNFDVDIERLNLQFIESFASNMINKSEGFLTAKIKVTGKASQPELNGSLSFKEAAFNLQYINNRLYFKDEKVSIDNKGIYFNTFTVLDSTGRPMIVKGAIYTTNFINMRYELDITTRNFTVLNTTAKNNKVYYGKIILNSTIKIRGDENLPQVTANANLIQGSEFTFVVQEGELSTDRGEGVVEFIDSTVNNIMNVATVNTVSDLKGIEFNASIEVNKLTHFKIITDKVSGDFLEVSGDAMMNFSIEPNGTISLTGTYVLHDGHYRASFQKIAKRDFTIKEGSTITWSGDPLDGQINLTAVYRTKTSATDLLAAELAGLPDSERNPYRKLLNFEVDLMMHGSLLKPKLNFMLDMPSKDQAAFNGMVYSKINMINADENELNKQVFSLLILGRFVPSGSSNGSPANAVNTVARNSVNQLLSDQLNTLSGRYVKGAELNFNLQSNDNYTTAGTQQNTEVQIGVKKELFNSRVSIQVGSSINVDQSSPQATNTSQQNITGDMVMEYKITEDGSYRFKAFRENQNEGVIDGLVYSTGVGIIYTRDYNKLSELFRPVKKKEEETGDQERK